MALQRALLRFCAPVAPACLLVYGILRWIDGLDGERGGLPWDVGHAFLLAGMVLLAMLTLAVRPLVPRHLAATTVATVAAVAGAACFVWVALGDLSVALPALPAALRLIGPLLFQVGTLTLLVQLVVAGRLTAWSPALMFFGFVAIAVNLDLLPLGAVLIGVGIAPLAANAAGADRTAPESELTGRVI